MYLLCIVSFAIDGDGDVVLGEVGTGGGAGVPPVEETGLLGMYVRLKLLALLLQVSYQSVPFPLQL